MYALRTYFLNMPEPQSKEYVRRLIGMFNYLSPYIPNMSAVTAPIRDLLKKETQFSWLPEHERAFQTVKQILSAEPLLKLYDESKKVTIQCDASSKGLGACLMQEGKPIAYASRSLTEVVSDRKGIARNSVCSRTFSSVHLWKGSRSRK